MEKYASALTPGLQLLPPKALEKQQINVLIAGLSEARLGFSPLDNVAMELNQIKSEVSGTELLNNKFTSTTLQEEISSNPFSVVHLATHGQFSSQAAQTFILASDKRINVNDLSNLLQSRDTSTQNAIELLVLSACETATGDKRAALGLAGVAVRAGARSTLATLWSVQDQSTALFMTNFYAQFSSAHISKAEAVRQAQLALMKHPLYDYPFHWSSYVLVGNWL